MDSVRRIDNTASYINRFHTITMELGPNTSGTGQPYTLTPAPRATMRLRARRFQIKARFKVVYLITMGLSICVFFGWNCVRTHELLSRIGLGVLSVWGIYVASQAYKWIWPSNLPPDAPVSTSLEFYRSELERRRDYERHVWRRAGLTFCFLGLAMAISPLLIALLHNPGLLVNALPFFVLLTIWFVAFFFGKKRGKNKLQQEIDELRTYESDAR